MFSSEFRMTKFVKDLRKSITRIDKCIVDLEEIIGEDFTQYRIDWIKNTIYTLYRKEMRG